MTPLSSRTEVPLDQSYRTSDVQKLKKAYNYRNINQEY